MTDEQINAIAQPFLHLGDGDTEHDSIDWRGFARAIREQALEEAAQMCETVGEGGCDGVTAEWCAKKIRERKSVNY